MRFHIGCSFRLKSLTKFIIPIGLGILAYFGFGGLFGCIKVYANSNASTTFSFNIPEVNLENYQIFSDYNALDFFNNLKNNESNYVNNYFVYYYTLDNGDFRFQILVFNNNNPFNLSFVGNGTNLKYGNISSQSVYSYFFFRSGGVNVGSSSSTVYSNLMSCLTSNTNCTQSVSENNNYQQQINTQTFSTITLLESNTQLTNNNSSYDFVSYLSYTKFRGYPFYSNVTLINDLTLATDDASLFAKSINVNGQYITQGDEIPTYYDFYLYSPPDEPDDPVDPDNPDNPDDKSIVDYIYWFTGENLTEYDVLVNLYVLLFLYCVTNLVIKFLTFVKGVKW